ncbi:GGDEF domain-containing protein [Cellulomonas sp. Marseille-Q8402]
MTLAPPDDPRSRDRGVPEMPVVVRLMTHAPAWLRVGGHAAAGGRVLLLFSGLVVVVGALCLGVDGHELRVLAGTSAAMLAVVGLSLLVRWRRDSRATLVFPVLVLVALGVLSLATESLATAFVGLIPLCFVYIGLFHRARAALAVLPVAWVVYGSMVPVLDGNVAVRLAIYGITWWAIAQLLAVSAAYQRTLRARLRADARTDALTSLGNRRDLDERLALAVPGDTLVIADLDHFKCVNDTQGHGAGDLVLERFGHAVDQHLRRRDYAARYGGEEFVLILPRTEPVQAMNMLRALRTEWAEEGTGVTFSAGIALITADSPSASALAAADVALYKAKQAGRDRFRIATEPLGARRAGAPVRDRRAGDDRRTPDAHQAVAARRDQHAGC